MVSSTGAALFSQGEAVFVRPIAHAWLQQPFTVIKRLWRRGRLPHYKLQAPDGGIWLGSQPARTGRQSNLELHRR